MRQFTYDVLWYKSPGGSQDPAIMASLLVAELPVLIFIYIGWLRFFSSFSSVSTLHTWTPLYDHLDTLLNGAATPSPERAAVICYA